MPLTSGLAPGTVAAIRRRYRAGLAISVIAADMRVTYEEACWALYGRDVRHEIVFMNQFHTRRDKAAGARPK
jgi:hypothetical protein